MKKHSYLVAAALALLYVTVAAAQQGQHPMLDAWPPGGPKHTRRPVASS